MGFGWKPYVSVAKRRTQAAGKMNTLKKKGLDIQPIEIAGRKIAHTFWGQSWCTHLEAFSDYANRLPRGRTYVRNGSVCHLLISSGEIKAIVSGSELYDVKIKIDMLPASKWSSVKERCSGQIGSLLELLQGRLSNSVMAVVTHRIDGLFPAPSEIRLDCSCPDWATMCKHVAAVLYGVGARLDERPELLFLLRGVDHEELISADAAAALTSTDSAKQKGRRRIATGELEDIFGIEIQAEAEACSSKPQPMATKTLAKSSPKTNNRAKTKTAIFDKTKPSLPSSPERPLTAKAVRDLRASLELTPANFAVLVGVTTATVNNWEKQKGRLNLQPRTMKSLAAAMKLTKQQAQRQLLGKPEATNDYFAVVNPSKLKKTQNKGNAAVAKTSNLPKIAEPNIETILAQFLEESAVSLKGSVAKREDAIDWFTDCLNNYGHQGLSAEETRLFDRYYDLDGDSHQEFCQVFGPDKITGSVSEFVGYYLIRQVMGTPASLGAAAKTISQLCQWLEKKEIITAEEAEYAVSRASKAAKLLPRAAKAAELLWSESKQIDRFGGNDIEESGYMRIARMTKNSLWLTPIGGKEIGPVTVPSEVVELLEVDWEINCALTKSRGKWRIIEVGNIYPH